MAEPLRKSAYHRSEPALSATVTGPRIPLVTFGLSFGLFLAITYVLCVGFDLLFPAQSMHQSWQSLLPGFAWLSWSSFLLGLVESFAYAW
ncbi:MAG: DUF5676 family membrane protein [Betaproteobacteria bacterium]|nr:DUF5676 family membrane protein [Betaproteobacteria bacterium]